MTFPHRAAGSPAKTIETDVVVVGARCAGAATALLLARAGHSVLVLDRAAFPSDTLSTHVIARSGMVQLHRWGLLEAVLATGAPPIRSIEFHSREGVTSREVKDRHGVDHLLAPRRSVLDHLLQRAAIESGAQIRTGVTVDDARWDGGRVVGVVGRDADGPVEVRARYVVGADGLGSRVARAVRAPLTVVRPSSGATQYAYFSGDWPALEYHLGGGGFAGVFPTHGGEACIWVCTPESSARRYRRLRGSADRALLSLLTDVAPSLAERLGDATPTSPVRGMLRMPNHFRQAVGPGWALVGDAGCHRDAITGHGISDAFRDAELLAGALDRSLRGPTSEGEALTAYQLNRDRMAAGLFDLTCQLAAFPDEERFLELQRQAARAVDAQAEELAALPLRHAAITAA